VSDRKGIETEEQVRSLVWSSYTEEEEEQEEVCLSVPSMVRGKSRLVSDRIECTYVCDLNEDSGTSIVAWYSQRSKGREFRRRKEDQSYVHSTRTCASLQASPFVRPSNPPLEG